MKSKIIILLTSSIISVVLLVSCNKPANNTVPSSTASPAPTIASSSVNTEYKKINESKTRPIAVMIDNDDENARPHSGIDSAYLLYEIPVEGGSTRIMALFKDVDTDKIGPVRSSRHYFLDYALENDAIYVHYGWSPQAQTDISRLRVNNINGVSGGYANFWREEKYKGDWHSAYTSVNKTMATASKMGYKAETDSPFPYKMSTEDAEIPNGQAINKILLPYAGFYKVSYNYDQEKKTFNRYINNTPHKTSKGAPLTAKNIIIQNTEVYAFGDGTERRQVDTVGKGKGMYISDGKYSSISWKKDSRKDKTKYFYENGEEIKLNPGVTYIQIVPNNMKIGIE